MKKTQHNTQRGSITLGMVFGLGLLAMTLVSIALSSVTNNIGTHRNELAGLRTFVTADTAAREGVYRILKPGPFNGSPDWNGEHTQDINSVLASGIIIDTHWPNIILEGNATDALTERVVRYTVRPSNYDLSFDHAIFATKDLTLFGNTTINGSVYVGEQFAMTKGAGKGSPEINGNVYVVESVDEDGIKQGAVKDGEIYDGVLQLTEPVIATSAYSITSPAECYSSDGNLSSIDWEGDCPVIHIVSTTSPITLSGHLLRTGPVYIEGDVEVQSNPIKMTCDSSYEAGEDWCSGTCVNPLVLYVDGNLTLNDGSFCGLVYVTGETSGTGGAEISGSLMTNKFGVYTTGNVDVTYNPKVMGNWKKISGLNEDGVNEKTEISGWGEK